MGACNGVSALFAIFIMANFGRRTIFIVGEAAMAICTGLSALGILQGWGWLAFIGLNCYLWAFHLSQGSMAWFYVSEVTNDNAAGLASSGQFISVSIISLSTDFMISSPMGGAGTMAYYSAWSVLGTIFCYFFVRESRGLTDN